MAELESDNKQLRESYRQLEERFAELETQHRKVQRENVELKMHDKAPSYTEVVSQSEQLAAKYRALEEVLEARNLELKELQDRLAKFPPLELRCTELESDNERRGSTQVLQVMNSGLQQRNLERQIHIEELVRALCGLLRCCDDDPRTILFALGVLEYALIFGAEEAAATTGTNPVVKIIKEADVLETIEKFHDYSSDEIEGRSRTILEACFLEEPFRDREEGSLNGECAPGQPRFGVRKERRTERALHSKIYDLQARKSLPEEREFQKLQVSNRELQTRIRELEEASSATEGLAQERELLSRIGVMENVKLVQKLREQICAHLAANNATLGALASAFYCQCASLPDEVWVACSKDLVGVLEALDFSSDNETEVGFERQALVVRHLKSVAEHVIPHIKRLPEGQQDLVQKHLEEYLKTPESIFRAPSQNSNPNEETHYFEECEFVIERIKWISDPPLKDVWWVRTSNGVTSYRKGSVFNEKADPPTAGWELLNPEHDAWWMDTSDPDGVTSFFKASESSNIPPKEWWKLVYPNGGAEAAALAENGVHLRTAPPEKSWYDQITLSRIRTFVCSC
jgi:hypothetical protein